MALPALAVSLASLALQFGIEYLTLKQKAAAEGRDVSDAEVAALRQKTDAAFDKIESKLENAAKDQGGA